MIPGRRVDRWFEKKAVIEALATVPPVLAAAIGALTSLSDPRTQVMGWWLAAGAVWLVGASTAKVLHARTEDRQRKRADDHEGLRAALHVLFAVVCEAACLRGRDRVNGRVRVTIHRMVPNGGDAPEELEQLLPYMGGAGEPPGRRFSIRSGAIGIAARKKIAVAAQRKNARYPEFISDMVVDWAYTEHDARKLSPDRYSWMAVPILDQKGSTVAVVYLDSSEPAFFSSTVQDRVLVACDGLSTYTREAYP